MHHSVADRWPSEASLVQPLRHQHHAAAIPCQKLHSVRALAAEHEDVAAVHGFAPSASLTSADNVCNDLRKSTGCAASTTLRSDRSAITGCPEAPTAPSKASPAPLP